MKKKKKNLALFAFQQISKRLVSRASSVECLIGNGQKEASRDKVYQWKRSRSRQASSLWQRCQTKSQCHPVVDTHARPFDASVNAVQRATEEEKIKERRKEEKKKRGRRMARRYGRSSFEKEWAFNDMWKFFYCCTVTGRQFDEDPRVEETTSTMDRRGILIRLDRLFVPCNRCINNLLLVLIQKYFES